MSKEHEMFTIDEASAWVTNEYDRNITPSNISYLIQYGHLRKFDDKGVLKVFKNDLVAYYSARYTLEKVWKEELGEDLNWQLSFDDIKEKDRTKHVHRLHPYKGKFIPQLVEYFLDSHTDNFKKEVFFDRDDIVLDPFCGSGTTLVQANELGIHAIGIDISEFNTLISNVKVSNPNLLVLSQELNKITLELERFISENNNNDFVNELTDILHKFNDEHFPSHDYIYKLRQGQIDEKSYSSEKEVEILEIYRELINQHNFQVNHANKANSFIDKWYLAPARREIEFIIDHVKDIDHQEIRNYVMIILSRTIRSCRATTHADLATLKEPVSAPYYCRKHYKICKPRFSIMYWWKRYSKDTLNRLEVYSSKRTDSMQYCLTGDSRNINIIEELEKNSPELAEKVKKKKIQGIFTSPPYLGLIDYHEQHAYAYELFGLKRRDDLEIGPMFNGKGKEARKSYIKSISEVLIKTRELLSKDYNIFMVANDDNNLFPKIAEKANLTIVNMFKRPVLNRTEKDKSPYGEIVFHLKEK